MRAHHRKCCVTIGVQEVRGGVHACCSFHLSPGLLHVLPVHVGAGRVVHKCELQQRPEYKRQAHPRPYVDGLCVRYGGQGGVDAGGLGRHGKQCCYTYTPRLLLVGIRKNIQFVVTTTSIIAQIYTYLLLSISFLLLSVFSLLLLSIKLEIKIKFKIILVLFFLKAI